MRDMLYYIYVKEKGTVSRFNRISLNNLNKTSGKQVNQRLSQMIHIINMRQLYKLFFYKTKCNSIKNTISIFIF